MSNTELERRLRAIREPVPSPALKTRLERGIPDPGDRRDTGWWPGRIWTMATAAAGIMILGFVGWLVTLFLSGPVAVAAVLEPVVEATAGVKSVHVVMRMLTREGEDFRYVNLDGQPRPVEAWVRWPVMPGDPGQARIDKPDRVYCFDGVETVFYHPERNEAFRAPGRGVDLELFWPASWVRQISNRSMEGVEVLEHEETAGRGRLLLRESGADTGGLEPSFLGEFDRETEVVWDLETHLLLDLRRWVYHDGERVLFSEIVEIEYPATMPEGLFRLELSEDVRWGIPKRAPLELLDLGPREVARRLFDAAARGDRDDLELFCAVPSMVDWLLAEENRPTEIVFVGEPFRAGNYPGVYVPYKVRFGDRDEVKTFQLALRNDNAQNRWMFDGGI